MVLVYGRVDQVGIIGGSGRKGMDDVAWHPDDGSCVCCATYPTSLIPKKATRLVTSSKDDNSPVFMVWDLRNAQAPEKVCLSDATFEV